MIQHTILHTYITYTTQKYGNPKIWENPNITFNIKYLHVIFGKFKHLKKDYGLQGLLSIVFPNLS